MPKLDKIYSRGNDDPNENIYETAKIMVTLHIDDSACKKDDKGICQGDVDIKFAYSAVRSTPDPNNEFQLIGPRFVLRQEGGLTNVNRLVFRNSNPNGNIGDTLTANLGLGSLPCSGGTMQGIVSLEAMLANGSFPGFVQERFSYEVEIGSCGKVITSSLTGLQLNPGIVLGRVATPFIDITDGSAGYPSFPGVPR